MKKLAEALYAIAIAIWFGGMVGIGYVAVPVLFTQIINKSVAGELAGEMFAIGGWVAIVCGLYILAFLWRRHGRAALGNRIFAIVVAMLLLTLVGQFLIQPIIAGLRAAAAPLPVMQSPLGPRFALWHTVSSALYVVQAIFGLVLVAQQRHGLAAEEPAA